MSGKIGFTKDFDDVSIDLIRRLLKVDQTRRLGNLKDGAKDIKEHPFFKGVDWDQVKNMKVCDPIQMRYSVLLNWVVSIGSTTFHSESPT